MSTKILSGLTVSLGLLAAGVSSHLALAGQTQADILENAIILNQVHHLNLKEIDASKLASSRAADSDVLGFAKKMIDEHSAADQKVQDLAKSKGVKLVSFQPADFEKLEKTRLESLKGRIFDHAFITTMRMGHKNAYQELQDARDSTDDTQIQALLSEILTHVQAHEQLAGNIQAHEEREMGGQKGE
jgi:putative membrane protein